MLIALLLAIGVLLTDEFSWLAADTSHVAATAAPVPRPVIAPEEPFTLTLALIGVATIAAYLVLSRTMRRRRVVQPFVRRSPAEESMPIDQPSRGAA